MSRKFGPLAALALLLCILTMGPASADSFDQVLKRWTKDRLYKGEDDITTLNIEVTYYSAEFIEAYINKEAETNLWTQQETEDFKYKFLQTLRMEDMIPIHIAFVNNAETMYLGPFDIIVKLIIGNKSYKPADYDKRFNFKFQGKKDGLVFFNRYDPKTGADLLSGVKNVTLELGGAISPAKTRGQATRFMWNVSKDDPSKLYAGRTAARLETDRLLKRLENLRKDRSEEEAKLKAIDDEINTIQTRLDELASIQ